MISRIKLKKPIWLVDPDKVHELLLEVERQMGGGGWETQGIYIDKGRRIYGFVPFRYEIED